MTEETFDHFNEGLNDSHISVELLQLCYSDLDFSISCDQPQLCANGLLIIYLLLHGDYNNNFMITVIQGFILRTKWAPWFCSIQP